MTQVKQILCLGEHTSSKCLEIFAAMADSACLLPVCQRQAVLWAAGPGYFPAAVRADHGTAAARGV